MEITVFKCKSYNSQEWYKDLLSEFKNQCRQRLKMNESEIDEIVNWASDEDIHCKKELVRLVHADPHNVLIEWEEFISEANKK
jgi:hypothetical protein